MFERAMPLCGLIPWNTTRRSDSGNCTGRSSTEFTSVNMALFAPIARASVAIAISVNTGCFNRLRMPYRRSLKSVSITTPIVQVCIPNVWAARRALQRLELKTAIAQINHLLKRLILVAGRTHLLNERGGNTVVSQPHQEVHCHVFIAERF